MYAVATGNGGLKFHQILRFRQNRVSVADAFSTDPTRVHAFKVLSTVKSFVVYAPDAATKHRWLNQVRSALSSLPDAHDPLLASDVALKPVIGGSSAPATPTASGSAPTATAATTKASSPPGLLFLAVLVFVYVFVCVCLYVFVCLFVYVFVCVFFCVCL